MSNTVIITDIESLKKVLTKITNEVTQAVVEQIRSDLQVYPELMTLKQTAAYLQCSPQSVKNWSRPSEKNKSRLLTCSAGADPRYYKSDVDAWLRCDKERSKISETGITHIN